MVITAGVVSRVLAIVGYSPGLWFLGDTNVYVTGSISHVPNPSRPYGYSLALWALSPFHSVRLIIGLQHLLGLAVAALMYVFLRRRDVSRWLATLAVAPILLDARTVLLEHFLLAESLFIALLVGAVIALCWSERPGWWAAAGAGVLLAAAAVTRTVALPLIAAVVLYLLIRRAGLLKIGVLVVAFVIPLVGYAVWYERHYDVYSLGTYTGRFMWARTTSFVECEKLDLTPRERQICPPEPIGERMPVDVYIWSRYSPAAKFPDRADDPMFGSFARKAILAQPGDYARTVAVETWLMIRPGPDPDERYACFDRLWRFPEQGYKANCRPVMAPYDLDGGGPGISAAQHRHALTGPLHVYGQVATVPATLTAICLLVAIVVPLVRWRRRVGQDRRDVIDALLLTGVAFGMIVISVATSVMEPRYTVPSIPLAALGAALALRRRPEPPPAPAPEPAPAEQVPAAA